MILQVGGGVVWLAPLNSVACIVYLMGMLRSIFRPFLWVGDLIEIVKSVEPFFEEAKKGREDMGIAMHVPKRTRVFPWTSLRQIEDDLIYLVHLFFFQEWFVNPMRFFFAMRSNTPCKNRRFFVMFSISFSWSDPLKWCEIPWPPSRKRGFLVKGHRIEFHHLFPHLQS